MKFLTEEDKIMSSLRKKELQKLWKKNNKEKQKQYQENHKKNYPNSSKERNKRFKINNPGRQQMLYKKFMLKRYNLTLEDYDNYFKKQNECCAICNKHFSLCKRNLHVDHDHKTGKVRGLLCNLCNSGLGHFKDNITSLEKAIEYLKKI